MNQYCYNGSNLVANREIKTKKLGPPPLPGLDLLVGAAPSTDI